MPIWNSHAWIGRQQETIHRRIRSGSLLYDLNSILGIWRVYVLGFRAEVQEAVDISADADRSEVCEEDVLNREGYEEGRIIVGSSFFVNEASQEEEPTIGPVGNLEMQQRGACAR